MKFNEDKNGDFNDIMKKTSRRMTLRIMRIYILCFVAIIIVINLPQVLYSLQGNRVIDAMRLNMLYSQFIRPDRVIGYSNESLSFLSTKTPLTIISRQVVGKNPFSGEQLEIGSPYNVLTGKITISYPIVGTFLHSSRYKEIDEKNRQFIMKENRTSEIVLEKNKDSTVALVDISFLKGHTLGEIADLLEGLDVEVEWLAIETGLEDSKSARLGMPSQQFFLWGIPSRLYTPDTIFDPMELDLKNPSAYLDKLFAELEWAKEHKYLLTKNNLTQFGLKEDTVITMGDYLKEKGILCYGLRVNGPSDQLLLLAQKQEYLRLNFVKLDFWYWDN